VITSSAAGTVMANLNSHPPNQLFDHFRVFSTAFLFAFFNFSLSFCFCFLKFDEL
jgi:hypothetical protein